MRRKLFILCSIASGVFCLATAGLWVRSYWLTDLISRHQVGLASEWGMGLGTLPGAVWIGHYRHDGSYQLTPGLHIDVGSPRHPTDTGGHFQFRFLGFGIFDSARSRSWRGRPVRLRQVALPFWFLCPLLAIMPVWGVAEIRRCRRESERLRGVACTQCGYNLTGNVSGIWPECGTDI